MILLTVQRGFDALARLTPNRSIKHRTRCMFGSFLANVAMQSPKSLLFVDNRNSDDSSLRACEASANSCRLASVDLSYNPVNNQQKQSV